MGEQFLAWEGYRSTVSGQAVHGLTSPPPPPTVNKRLWKHHPPSFYWKKTTAGDRNTDLMFSGLPYSGWYYTDRQTDRHNTQTQTQTHTTHTHTNHTHTRTHARTHTRAHTHTHTHTHTHLINHWFQSQKIIVARLGVKLIYIPKKKKLNFLSNIH